MALQRIMPHITKQCPCTGTRCLEERSNLFPLVVYKELRNNNAALHAHLRAKSKAHNQKSAENQSGRINNIRHETECPENITQDEPTQRQNETKKAHIILLCLCLEARLLHNPCPVARLHNTHFRVVRVLLIRVNQGICEALQRHYFGHGLCKH